jgi:hypothetical protein
MENNVFKGVWNVVATERRVRGAWVHEYDFQPDDWSVGFLPDGRYVEIFRPEGEKKSGRWVFDDRRGLIAISLSTSPKFLQRCVFEGAGAEGWLYFYDDASHIPLDPSAIIAHHSHERQKLVRSYSSTMTL